MQRTKGEGQRVLCAILIAIAGITGVDAVTVAPITFERLVDESRSIVYARVSDVEGRWTSDRSGIESLVTVSVLDTLKGADRATQQLLLPGGHAGGRINVIPGAPVLREGDLVVLFLAASGPSIARPVGLTQGVLRVSTDPRRGTPMVAAPPLASGSAPRGTAARAPVTLAELGARVRALEAAR